MPHSDERSGWPLRVVVRNAILPLSGIAFLLAAAAGVIRLVAPTRDVSALAVAVIGLAFVLHLVYLATLPFSQSRVRVDFWPLNEDGWLLSLMLLFVAIVVGGSDHTKELPGILRVLIVEFGPGSAWGGVLFIVIRALSLRLARTACPPSGGAPSRTSSR